MTPTDTVKYRVQGTTKQGRKVLLSDSYDKPEDAEEEAEYCRNWGGDHNWNGEFVVLIQKTTFEVYSSNTN